MKNNNNWSIKRRIGDKQKQKRYATVRRQRAPARSVNQFMVSSRTRTLSIGGDGFREMPYWAADYSFQEGQI